MGMRAETMTKEQLLERKAFIASSLESLTAKMANAKMEIVRERIAGRIKFLNSQLDRINEMLAKHSVPRS